MFGTTASSVTWHKIFVRKYMAKNIRLMSGVRTKGA